MAPQVLATFRAVFAGSERGKAFSIYGAMLGFASAVGLLLGGVLTEANLFGWSWRAVFFVNIPVAVAALIAGLRFVPETRDPGARRPDVTGAVLLAASLVAIVYPLLEGRQLGWPAWVWVLLAAGVAGLGVLGLLEARRTGRADGPAPLLRRGCSGCRRSRPGSECRWRSRPGCRGSSWPSRCGCRPASTSRR
jgi:MFS family permease